MICQTGFVFREFVPTVYNSEIFPKHANYTTLFKTDASHCEASLNSTIFQIHASQKHYYKQMKVIIKLV